MRDSIAEIENYFSIDKIKSDIANYLSINDIEQVVVVFYEETFTGKEIENSYSLNEDHTLIKIEITRRFHNLFFFPIIVTVGIGLFEKESNLNSFSVTKMIFELMYDDDLDLITIDFYDNKRI